MKKLAKGSEQIQAPFSTQLLWPG